MITDGMGKVKIGKRMKEALRYKIIRKTVTGSFARTGRGVVLVLVCQKPETVFNVDYWRPVEPKPPSPRTVSLSSSVISK